MPANQRSAVVQRYWLDSHDPSGRVRTMWPSIDSCKRIRLVSETRASYGLPSASSTCCCSCATIGVNARPGSGGPSSQHGERGGAGVVDEGVGGGDALRLDQLRRAATLGGDSALRARRIDDGGEIERNDEHRAAHAQQCERASGVRRARRRDPPT